MTRRGSLAVMTTIAVLVASACGSSTTPPPSTAASAGPGASSAAAVGGPIGALGTMPSVPDGTEPAFLAAAQAELGIRDALRKEIDVAGAIGDGADGILKASDDVEGAFGADGLKALVDHYGIDLSSAALERQLAAIDGPGLPPDPGQLDEEWTGSLIGNTSFTASMYLALTPELFPTATGPYQQESQSRTEEHDSESSGIKEHLTLTQNLTVGRGGGRILMDVTLTANSVLTRASSGTEVAHRTSTSTGHFEMDGCPAVDGSAKGTYTISNAETIAPSSGSTRGGTSATTGPFTALDGDDAHLIKTDFSATVAASTQGRVGGDWSVGATFPISIPARGGIAAIQIGGPQNPTESNATQASASSLAGMLLMAGNYLGDAAKEAEKFWRGGNCIELKTSEESKLVPPSKQLQISVDAQHKFDGSKVQAGITGKFSGKDHLDPDGRKQDPTANLTFKAGANEGDKGTIDLEQVGKRGIGKKQLVFTVGLQDYKLNIVQAGNGFTAQKCNGPTGRWVINESIGGKPVGTWTFTLPEGSNTGTVHAVYDVAQGPVSAHWDQTGTVTFADGDPPMLAFGTLNGTVTVNIGGKKVTRSGASGPFDFQLEAGKFCN